MVKETIPMSILQKLFKHFKQTTTPIAFKMVSEWVIAFVFSTMFLCCYEFINKDFPNGVILHLNYALIFAGHMALLAGCFAKPDIVYVHSHRFIQLWCRIFFTGLITVDLIKIAYGFDFHAMMWIIPLLIVGVFFSIDANSALDPDEQPSLRDRIAEALMRWELAGGTNDWPTDKVRSVLACVDEDHSGDCTKNNWTCLKCMADEVYRHTDQLLALISEE